jgi:hypothetical protein
VTRTLTFVVVPEHVARHWWEQLLYNQATRQLRRALIGRPNTVVTNAPYRRTEMPAFLAGAHAGSRPDRDS